MKWVLVFYVCPGFILGWSARQAETTKVNVPDQPTRAAPRALNPGSECWAKPDPQGQR